MVTATNARSLTRSAGEHGQRKRLAVLLVLFILSWLVSLDQTIFFGLVGVWALEYNRKNGRPQYVPARIAGPILAITVLAIISLTWTDYTGNALRTIVVWGTGLVLCVAYYNSSRQLKKTLTALLLGVWILSLIVYAVSIANSAIIRSIVDLKIRSGFSSSRQASTPSIFLDFEVLRPIGFALYANELALFGMISVAIFIMERPKIRKTTIRLLLIVMFAGLLLSTSRSIILTYIVGSAVVVLIRYRPHASVSPSAILVRLLLVISAIGITTMLYPTVWSDIAQSLSGLAEARYGASERLRTLSYNRGLEVFNENLLTGVGGLPQLPNIQVGSHSLPLSLAVKHGLPGLLAFAALMSAAAINGVRMVLRGTPAQARVGTILLVCILSGITIQFDDDILSFAAFILAVTATHASVYQDENLGENNELKH